MLGFSKHQQPQAEETVPRKLAIKIVIASEDARNAARARELSEKLARELRPAMEITSEVWRFNFLRHEDVRNVALASVAEADIVVIAAHDDGELPECVKMWIEDWVPLTRNGPTVLLALLDRYVEMPGNSGSLCAFLRRIARRAGMDFYLKAGDESEPDFRHIAVDEYETDVDAGASLDEDVPRTSLFQSGRFMPETAHAGLNNYGHSTAVS